MMPSRGFRLPKGTPMRLYQLQWRNLSSTPARSSLRLVPRTASGSALLSRQINVASSRVILGGSAVIGVRYASWWNPFGSSGPAESIEALHRPAAPAAPPPAPDQAVSANLATTTAPDPATTTIPLPELPTLDTIKLDDIDITKSTEELAKIPEHIGYMKEIGLDYGWGPTSVLQWTLEHVHIYSGLPWWGSIAVTALILRTIMFPLYIKSADSQARSTAMMSVTKPLMAKMKEAQKAGDSAGVQLALMEFRAVQAQAGFSIKDQFIPLGVQAIAGFCMFKFLRAAASLPVPGFKDGGFLWLSDLTLSDPYLLLPLIMAGSMHLLVRFGGESGSQNVDSMGQTMRKVMLYGMPCLIMVITGSLQGAVCVWFAATTGLGICQAFLFRNENVRRKLGIAPIYKPKDGSKPDSPLTQLLGQYAPSEPSAARSSPSSASARSTASSSQPIWQAPTLKARSTGAIIDVKPIKPVTNSRPSSVPHAAATPDVAAAPAATSEGGKSEGLLGRAKGMYNNVKDKAAAETKRRQEQNRKDSLKKRAEEYEKRARERGR